MYPMIVIYVKSSFRLLETVYNLVMGDILQDTAGLS